MESENETRPLLHSFEKESWRSRARKRCMRIPSEVTITGIILGLFFIVVTLLIMLENMETEKKDDITLEPNLLGSPFKYNKKAEDKSWQDKKDNMKSKKDNTEYKWDNVKKGWKKFPDISGKIESPVSKLLQKKWEVNTETSEIVKLVDEYGKEIDNSWEAFLDERNKNADYKNLKDNKEAKRHKAINDEWMDGMNILQSPKSSFKKFVKSDSGWQKLSDQGWKNKEIVEALIDAWNNRTEHSTETVLQSPMNVQDLWGKATDFFKNIFNKGTKEQSSQKSINDEWKSKFNLLQSSMASYKKWKNNDELKKKKFKKDWKDKTATSSTTEDENDLTSQQPINFEDFMDDLIEKIKEHIKDRKDKTTDKTEEENGEVLQSPIKFEDFLENIFEVIKDHEKAGKDKEKSQKETNDEWANKFNVLKSTMSPYKKWKKSTDFVEKPSKYDWKSKTTSKTFEENDEPLQSPMKFEDFMDDVIEKIKEHKKNNKEAEKQKDINDEFKKGLGILQSSQQTDSKWKQVDDHFKMIIAHERNSYFGKNDGDVTSAPWDNELQPSMSLDNIKWEKIDNEWKKLIDDGWKDKDIKEAVYNAWKDGDKLLQSAVGNKDMKWKKVNEGWKKISNKSIAVPTRCPISKFHRELLLGSTMPETPIDCALITEEVRREFGRCIDLSFLPKECKPSWREKCFSSYKYRKLDGTCNNKMHPTWGKSGTPFVRMIAPDYADGVSALRVAKDGGPLPNPRFLSRKLYSKQMKPDGDTSILFLYFGLLVDHDMVETAINSGSISCCNENFLLNRENRPKECLQIDIPTDDPFYGPKNVNCLNLVRSIPVNGECAGRREQLNKATSFLDASVVYGSVINQAKQLRTFSRGQLKTILINNTPFMSTAEGAGYSCGTPDKPLKCFEAGDSRVNMMVELTAMHTLWYREHNRIATELHTLNPQWHDEILFQEARRILTGELQHIAYNEFLPILLGQKALENYEIMIDESKIYEGYDETVNPSVFNVFAAAAFRFGHSLVPDMQYLLGANNSTVSKVPLHETFFNANILYLNGLDLLLRGAAEQRTHSVDSYISPEVREHLFQPADLDYGYDLAAVGIQRGRDHGLPPYTKWRSVCGLSDVKTWDDLYTIMDEERADMFKNSYKSVEDIDLIPAALAETHEEGSLVGPTYSCLIGRQFKKTRKGDRFWFEIQNEIGAFTRGQLDQIYKSNMARIICDNSDNIKKIQRYPFKIPSDHNPILDCGGIQKVDLSEWKSNIM